MILVLAKGVLGIQDLVLKMHQDACIEATNNFENVMWFEGNVGPFICNAKL